MLYHNLTKHIVDVLLLVATLLAAIGSIGDPFLSSLTAAIVVIFVASVAALVLLFDSVWDIIMFFAMRHLISEQRFIARCVELVSTRQRARCLVRCNVIVVTISTAVIYPVYGYGVSWWVLACFFWTHLASYLRFFLFDVRLEHTIQEMKRLTAIIKSNQTNTIVK